MFRFADRTALTLFALATLVARPVSADLVWVEAEHFQPGGWLNDSQFIDQMGSPYLLAVGLGTPVTDAVTHVQLTHAGRWRLWVRTKDWVPEHHPGRFQVLVNGVPAAREFGASGKPGWHWEDGGPLDLSGRIELRLHDRTGYYSRCDALVLASDTAWVPPPDDEPLAKLRAKLGGVSPTIEDAGSYDVVVVGGGLAGCTAAVAAARFGANVALVQNRPMLGGNASPEILVPPVGVWPHGRHLGPFDPRETGLVEEYRTAGNQRVGEGMLYAERLHRWVRLEPDLRLWLNTHATGVEMRCMGPRVIDAVLVQEVRTGRRMRLRGQMVIDCTGDATIGFWAGAECRAGKEPKSMYREPYALDEPSPHTMGNGLKYFYQDTSEPQAFASPPWAYRFPTCTSFGPGRHPRFIRGIDIDDQWIIELGGLRDTYAESEEIRDDLLRLVYGLWDHTKNHCPRDRQRAETCKLAWVGYVAGKRENRRLIGDYVLTQNDIGAQTLFADRVAYGGWTVDDHHSGGFFHQGSFGRHYDEPRFAYQGVPFSIPWRSLYSRNVANLLMAGRNISASHLALSDTRVMLTCAVVGQAAGTGAALAARHGVPPREVGQNHLAELQQQLLKDGAWLIDLRNADPRDLARTARVSASSEGRWGSGRQAPASAAIDGLARVFGDDPSAWLPDSAATAPHWIELSWPVPQWFNMVHVVFQTTALAPRRFALECWREEGWRPLSSIDVQRRRHLLAFERQHAARLRLRLDEPRGLCEIRVYDEPKREVEIARRAEDNQRRPDRGPWLPWDQGKPPEHWSTKPTKP